MSVTYPGGSGQEVNLLDVGRVGALPVDPEQLYDCSERIGHRLLVALLDAEAPWQIFYHSAY